MDGRITVEQLSERHTVHASARIPRPELATGLRRLLERVLAFVEERDVTPAGPPFVRFPEWGGAVLHAEVGVPLSEPARGGDGVVASKLAGGPAAVAVHDGEYQGLREHYLEMAAWCEREGWISSGSPWQIFWTDPWSGEGTPQSGTTQVFFPVRRP